MPIESKIIDTTPDTEYKGTVYEQCVVIELPDGEQMGIFDSDMIISDGMIGETLSLSILGYIPKSVEILDESDHQIEPFPDAPLDWQNHTYYGRIEKIGSSNNPKRLLLDVGYGTVQIDSDIHTYIDEELVEGMYIRVQTSRSDLLGIRNKN